MFLTNITVILHPDKTGRTLEIPGLVGEHGIFLPLLRYLEFRQTEVGQATMLKIREAVRLYFEYSAIHMFDRLDGATVRETRHWRHFSRFHAAIVHGTFDQATGFDKSSLNWIGSGVGKGRRVVGYLTDFFVYWESLDECGVSGRNPNYPPSGYDEAVARSAYEFRRGRALLGHTWGTYEQGKLQRHAIRGPRSVRPQRAAPPRLADGHFDRLLNDGFTDSFSGKRDRLILILMDKGGLRISDALHLWIVDVTPDLSAPGSAMVIVQHPSESTHVPLSRGIRFDNRAEYLSKMHGLRPRNLVDGRLQLGWKSRSYRELEVHWFEPKWGEIFMEKWREYLQVLSNVERRNPYAFVVLSGPTAGEPLARTAFNESLKLAALRAGLIEKGEKGLKNRGLTPHGSRHAYGNRAKNEAQLNAKIVQSMLHHSSAESQDTYTALDSVQIRSAIHQGYERLKTRKSLDDPQGEA